MRLQTVKYAEFEGTPQEWVLEGLSLGDRNLIVGKNASGKSRALNLINGLAGVLAGLRPLGFSGNYDVTFITQDNKTLRYQLKNDGEQVLEERLFVEGIVRLDRGSGGEGVIWAEELDGGKDIRFQTPPSQLAAVVRRDAIQHKFLEPLYDWGSSLRHYLFGTALGKDALAVFIKGGRMFDERDPNAVVALYREAEKEFKDEFKQIVMSDMGEVDYEIDEIGIGVPISIRVVPGTLPGELVGLNVKEKGLAGITDQHSMSQGMFRVLSILILVNYSQMAKKSKCILIDDVGEGLDFDRSCRLIDLLRKKSKESNIQLILATNDRFVMNRVPLEEWSVIQRRGNHVKVRNYENSRDLFEEFKFTGLSNFSFLEMDFVSGRPINGGA